MSRERRPGERWKQRTTVKTLRRCFRVRRFSDTFERARLILLLRKRTDRRVPRGSWTKRPGDNGVYITTAFAEHSYMCTGQIPLGCPALSILLWDENVLPLKRIYYAGFRFQSKRKHKQSDRAVGKYAVGRVNGSYRTWSCPRERRSIMFRPSHWKPVLITNKT